VRGRRGDWETRGSLSFEESAEQRVRDILSKEPKQYLDAHQQAELKRLEQSAMGK
jgi:trimethylamine:corrinoid methyltransferase-like protein